MFDKISPKIQSMIGSVKGQLTADNITSKLRSGISAALRGDSSMMLPSEVVNAIAMKAANHPQFTYNFSVAFPALINPIHEGHLFPTNIPFGDEFDGPMGDDADFDEDEIDDGEPLPEMIPIPLTTLGHPSGDRGFTYMDIAAMGDDLSVIDHRVTSIEIPHVNYESRGSLVGGGLNLSQAYSPNIGTMTITVDEFEDGRTYSYFSAWMNKIGGIRSHSEDPRFANKFIGQNPPAIYTKNITVTTFSSVIRENSYAFIECFPISIAPTSMNYEDGSVTAYTITFTVVSKEMYNIPPQLTQQVIDEVQSGILRLNTDYGLPIPGLGQVGKAVVAAAGGLLRR